MILLTRVLRYVNVLSRCKFRFTSILVITGILQYYCSLNLKDTVFMKKQI